MRTKGWCRSRTSFFVQSISGSLFPQEILLQQRLFLTRKGNIGWETTNHMPRLERLALIKALQKILKSEAEAEAKAAGGLPRAPRAGIGTAKLS